MRSYADEGAEARRIDRRWWPALLVAAGLAAALAACDRLPPDCRTGDQDDQQMSTRVLFLERLNGCPVGGRN